MRILWFNHRDIRHPQAGGAELTIYEVGRRLVMGGFEMHLASVNPGNLPAEENIDGIVIHRMCGNLRAHFIAPVLIKRLKPDVIIDDMAHVVPWGSPFFTDIKVNVFFRHLHARSLPGQTREPLAQFLIWLERSYRLIYPNSAFVTETSAGMNDLIRLGIRKECIRKIPPGVDLKLFRPWRKTEKPSLVYFGGMRDYKRPWLAVEVIRMLSDIEGITLTVIGEGSALNKMIKISRSCNLTGRISFRGHLPRDELAKVVSASWVNLHFSVTEGFGYSILEAAAAGTPTIALDAPGVSEVVSGYGLGKVVKNLNEFPLAFNDMLGNYKNWSRDVETSATSFSWDKCVEMWKELIIEEM